MHEVGGDFLEGGGLKPLALLQNQVERALGQGIEGLRHGGQRGPGDGGCGDVVKTDHRHIVRNSISLALEFQNRGERHLVIGREDCVKGGAVWQFLEGADSAGSGEVALDHPHRVADDLSFFESLSKAKIAIGRLLTVRATPNEQNVPAPMLDDQVARGRVHCTAVVHQDRGNKRQAITNAGGRARPPALRQLAQALESVTEYAGHHDEPVGIFSVGESLLHLSPGDVVSGARPSDGQEFKRDALLLRRSRHRITECVAVGAAISI